MVKVAIQIAGKSVYIDRDKLAKDLTGAEYPNNCYLDIPDDNGIYQPDQEALIEYQVSVVEAERDTSLASVGDSIEVDGIEFEINDAARRKLIEVITLFTPLGSLPEGFTWRAKDNTMCVVDLAFLHKLALSYGEAEQAIWMESFNTKDMLRSVEQNIVDLTNE